MSNKLTQDEAEARRLKILTAARWCFLNFGFSKTSLDDISKRANISRTLLYRTFKDKEDIFTAVFAEWLVSRHPAAKAAADRDGSPSERLLDVCRLMVIEPWADMVGAPMAGEFFDVCERIDPEIEALHRRVASECVATILGGEEAAAEVFLLALDGLLSDEPTTTVLQQRVQLLAARFVPPINKRK
ncbi:TetR/AcrR family transcriptional regulator [Bradyrhizobium manausense]|uniref:TetR/AcrR family transcriptional regulator n=1 Tax=Bradyrhizobium TaxID=374 RepID=UPI001BA61196|nr:MULTISPECIES: TetR/AcrR family transcriptional regulator [Bradyrhizobium]MBR0826907.1 TetR/AcrR family transcriptional regulator [Bradyrhizobium manausense]UVO32189.1 TetR/AcrR family transcriptional regulator [Bradyrhizobium arachidis]